MIKEETSIYFDDNVIEDINKTERKINESECGFKIEVVVNKEYNDMLDIFINNDTTFEFALDSEAYAYVSGIRNCLIMMNVIKEE